MTPERWRAIERLYHAARERHPDDRPAFLREATAGDDALRGIVESLLEPRAEEAGFLKTPAGHPLPWHHTDPDTPTVPDSDDAGHSRGVSRRRPWWVWCAALLAAVGAAGLYWVFLTGPAPIGCALRLHDDAAGIIWRVHRIRRGGAADRAGVEVNDLVSGVALQRFLDRREPYAPHALEIERRGERNVLILTAARKNLRYWLEHEGSWRRLFLGANSALYLTLAGLVIFSRPHDRSARWGALLLMQLGFLMLYQTLGPWIPGSPDISHALRALPLPVGIMALLGMSVSAMVPAGAFGFCSVFPRPLPMSTRRWWPWIFLFGPVATLAIDLDFFWLPVYGSPASATLPPVVPVAGYLLGVIFLVWSLFLLVRSYRGVERRNERRRLRIVALGFGLTLSAITAGTLVMTTPWGPLEEINARYWQGSIWQALTFSLYAAAPVCTSYAILRHRVFDIHVMVRLGLRYAAARGVLLSIVPVIGLILVLDVLTHHAQPAIEILAQRGPIYAAVGAGALVLHAKRKAWMDALDRRFFRERYDAYQLLSGVADDVRRSPSFDEAAHHVIARVDGALHPESVSLIVREPGEPAFRTAAAVNDPIRTFPADARVIELSRVLDKPLEIPQSGTGWLQEQLPRTEVKLLQRARVEWLFPVSLGKHGAEAFLLLGPKRSEEPYSREDRMMLQAITASLGLLLERLAASATGFRECLACGACYDSGSERCGDDGGALMKSPYSRTLAGRYRLDRRLGRGGMGTVYEAFDGRLERRVALKVIRAEWTASADAATRFQREAKAAASFTHPHVVTVHDFGVADDGRAYLVMELLEGRTLRDALRDPGRLDARRALGILRGVSAAVATAHERRLLHRDLKPENIFLVRSEDGEVAKVLDFGLAKPLDSTASLTSTAPGALLGTVAYMSPEQRAGEPPGESWDIWALTVIAFEMLTGAHPFTLSGDRRAAAAGGWVPTTRAAEPLRAPAAAFFDRALAIDPGRRPASVRQLIEELGAVLAE